MRWSAIIVISVMLIAGGLFLYKPFNYISGLIKSEEEEESLATDEAMRMYQLCEHESNNKERCYALLFSDATKREGALKAREMLHALQKNDPTALVCHGIAHAIGEAAIETNLQKKEDIFRSTDFTECESGFYHGALEALKFYDPAFKLDKEYVENLCSMYSACAHTFGHLVVVDNALRNGLIDARTSIQKCEELFDGMNLSSCFDGVFMEHIMKQTLADHKLAERSPWAMSTAEEGEALCKQFDGKPAEACWGVVGSIYSVANTHRIEIWAPLCEKLGTGDAFWNCYRHAAEIAALQNSLDQEKVNALCLYFSSDESLLERCVLHIVSALVGTSQAFISRAEHLCGILPESARSNCRETVYKK